MHCSLALRVAIIGVLCVSGAETQATCDSTTSNNMTQTLLADVTSSSASVNMDLMLLLDESPSVLDSAAQMADIVTSLMTFLSRDCVAQFSDDADRVALIPFGISDDSTRADHTFDGISDASLSSNLCDFLRFVGELEQRMRDIDRSQTDTVSLIAALDEARDIMNAATMTSVSAQRLQLLVIFHDGEVHSTYDNLDAEYDAALDASLQQLRDLGVIVYTLGVGPWLDSEDKVSRLQSLATGLSRFACGERALQDLQGSSSSGSVNLLTINKVNVKSNA